MNSNHEVVTIATHSDGYFENLINNKYTKVKVLGMGKKWTGFKLKSELVYDYIKDFPDNKIIIVIDGFDTVINGNINNAIEIFKKQNNKVLISIDEKTHYKTSLSKLKGKILKRFNFFGYCKNNLSLNAGLYMGYVKYLKIILNEIINTKCKDDQLILSKSCNKYDFIDLDENQIIFKNISFSRHNPNIKYKQIFLGYPANYSIKRYYRGLFEYSQFFIKTLLLLLFLLILFLYKKKRFNSIIIAIILFSLFIHKIDKSCMFY